MQNRNRVRDWALSLGYPLAARGPVPRVLVERYNAAHPDDQVPVSKPWGPNVEYALMRERSRIGGLSRAYGSNSPIVEAARYESSG